MKLTPLKRFVDPARPITYGIVQAGEDVAVGIPYIRPVDMHSHSGVLDVAELRRTSPEIARQYRRSTVRAGDLIVSIGPSYGKTMEVPEELDGANLTQGTARLAVRAGVLSHYVAWALQSQLAIDYWNAAVGGATFRALNLEPLALTPVPEWRVERQFAIADFLDTETARIDAVVTKKRRMIGLLVERLSAFVRARLAPVEPKLALRRRWTVVDCKHRTPEYVPVGYPVVSPGDVTPGRLDLSRAHRFVGEQDLADLADTLRRPRRGDIVYSRNASIGIASFVDTDQRFCMGQDVCRITSTGQDQLFLTYVLNSVGMDQLDMQKIGSTFSRINVAQILDLDIPCPSPRVQRELAAEFDSHSEINIQTGRSFERQIALLQEHRQALITAAVTGELDIPGAAA